MRAYETKQGLKLTTWKYPWGVASGGYSVYSEEEVKKLQADAREPIADEVLNDLNEKFR